MRNFLFYKWKLKLILFILGIFTLPTQFTLTYAGASRYNTVYDVWQWLKSDNIVEREKPWLLEGIFYFLISYFIILSIIFYIIYRIKRRKVIKQDNI